jgi:hypothetical protein
MSLSGRITRPLWSQCGTYEIVMSEVPLYTVVIHASVQAVLDRLSQPLFAGIEF